MSLQLSCERFEIKLEDYEKATQNCNDSQFSYRLNHCQTLNLCEANTMKPFNIAIRSLSVHAECFHYANLYQPVPHRFQASTAQNLANRNRLGEIFTSHSNNDKRKIA